MSAVVSISTKLNARRGAGDAWRAPAQCFAAGRRRTPTGVAQRRDDTGRFDC